MANNFIPVDQTQMRGATLVQTTTKLAEALSVLAQIKKVMDQMTDGVTFSQIETSFGLPAGKGQSVYNLVAGTIADSNASANITQLQSWLGVAWMP